MPTFICLKVLENRNYTLTVKQLVDTDSEQTLRNKTISNTTINNSTINGTNINNSHLNNTTSIGTFKVESGSITFGEESDPNQTTMYQDNLFVRNMNDRMQFKAGVLDYSKNAGSYGHYLFNDVPNQNVYLAYSVSNENSNIDNAFLGVRNDINSAKGDISSLQSDIDDINNELSTINGSITTIKNDVSTLKSNVSTLQGNVGTIQGDVSTINGEIDTINSDLDKKLNKLQLAQGNLLYARVNGIDLGAVYDTQAQANTIVARDNQGHVIGATPTDPTHLTTKSYVDSAIGSVSTIKFSIVSELPSTGESNIIYLVPNTTSSEKNVYDEYIWVNNAFEIIGSTAVDLTNYAKLNSDNIFTGVQYFNNTSGILIDGFKLNNAFLTNWRTKINKIDGIETDITSIENNVNSLTTKVSTNTTNISTNTSDITQVKQDLNSKLDKTTKAGAYVNQGDSVLNIPISYAPAASAIPRYNGAGALRSESVDWSTATATTVINKNMFEDNFKATFNEKCIPTITISSLSGTLSDSDYEKLVNSDMAKIVSPLGSFVAFKYTFPQQQNNLYYYTYETNESGTTCYSFVVTNGTTKTFVVNDYTVGGGGSVETISVTVTVDQQYPIEPFKQYTATISKADFDKVKEGVAVNIILNLNGQVIPYCSIPTVTSYDNFYFYFYLPDILGILSEYQNVADFFLSFEASGETITGTFMAVADTDTFTPETITITDIQETIIGRKGTFNSADYSKLKVGVPINLNIENEVYGCLVMYQDRNANFGVFEPMQGDMWSFTDTGVCIGAKQYPKFNTQNTFKSIQHFNGGLTAGENNELTINSNGALSITDSNGTVGLSGQGLMYRVGGSTNLLKMPTDSVSNNTEIVSKGYLGSQFTIQTTTVSKDFNRGVQSGQIAGRLDTGLTDENIIITSMYDTTNQVEFMDPYYDGTKWYATAICVAQGITGASNVQIKYIRLP